jgi:exoribonuclease-2
MNANDQNHRAILKSIAHRAMLERGLLPDFSSEALAELGRLQHSTAIDSNTIRDRRNLLWASIDNDDSRDLDQLTVADATALIYRQRVCCIRKVESIKEFMWNKIK